MQLDRLLVYLESARIRWLKEWAWTLLRAPLQDRICWPGGAPQDQWHSFDRHPWLHPWTTQNNIKTFRTFSDAWLSKLSHEFDQRQNKPKTFALVGNMANNLYMRGRALTHRNLSFDVYLHPHDRFLMSHPSWEEYDGDVPDGVTTIEQAMGAGISLPAVAGVFRQETVSYTTVQVQHMVGAMRFLDIKRFPDYFAYFPTLLALQKYDALLAVQVPYLAYLSGRPYSVTQMGGDIWYECSRDDLYGRLQRRSFEKASCFVVSNPWSLSFARRYGLTNLVYLPFIIDETKYRPGPATLRAEWRARAGGEFFVMMSSRLDYQFKGSHIAIQAFARFALMAPAARLVIAGWGADKAKALALFESLGIADKVLIVPVAGKKHVVEYLRSADCLLDQISLGYYGATALEGMACGVPVIMRLNRTQYDALLPEGGPPVCNVETEDDVVRCLAALFEDVNMRRDKGEKLREWFLETHSNSKWGKLYEAVLWGTAEGRLPSFVTSPLAMRLQPDESAYHRSGLAGAPQFPNYV